MPPKNKKRTGESCTPIRPTKYPKVKGCYECSRRRISCDRQSPECRKCQVKGLNCSGIALRYRFNDGLAARGKLVGKTYPLAEGEPSCSNPCQGQHTAPNPNHEAKVSKSTTNQDSFPIDQTLELDDDQDSAGIAEDAEPTILEIMGIGWELDHLDKTTRSLLSYFSTNIAPILAVIDRGFNGYRDLILPFSESNSLVRKTIVMISTEHISSRLKGHLTPSAHLYHEVLQGLRHRSLIHPPQQDHVAMTTFLLLLVREMITGGDRFSRTYAMLRHLIRQGGTDYISGSAVGRFVAIQILRVQLCAESVFGEAEGQHLIQVQLEHCLEFLRLCQALHPEHSRLMTLLYDLVTKACTMYVQRAVSDPDYEITQHLVEQFKQTADLVSEYDGVVGWQLLHWPYFIAAAESSSSEHRAFFVEKLRVMYQKTGCQNTAKAIHQLEVLWSRQSATRWTSLLGGHEQVFIM